MAGGTRHWLAFMEKRLKLAKRLLKPDTGVLIVTIDEKEYLHLEDAARTPLSRARIQMINAIGSDIAIVGCAATAIFCRWLVRQGLRGSS